MDFRPYIKARGQGGAEVNPTLLPKACVLTRGCVSQEEGGLPSSSLKDTVEMNQGPVWSLTPGISFPPCILGSSEWQTQNKNHLLDRDASGSFNHLFLIK